MRRYLDLKRLGPEQLLGGALVVTAVVVLEWGGRSSELFSRLPRRERWRLALLTHAIDVPAGSRLIREGMSADSFFLIERGRATVARDAHRIADLRTGDFFGELALLHGSSRTASVVAATDMRVRVIPGRKFAGAMRTLPTLARTVRCAAVERFVPRSAHVAAGPIAARSA